MSVKSSTQTAVGDEIQAIIGGQVSGQVAVGKYILQIGAIQGGVVTIAPPGQEAKDRIRPRPAPHLLPRPAEGFLNRDEEVREAANALGGYSPVELHGSDGIGKSTLLSYLAHTLPGDAFPDGVVYVSARRRSYEEVLDALFESFYETEGAVKPTEQQVRIGLSSKRALLLLDDVGLSKTEVEDVLETAASCAVLLTARRRCLWGRGVARRLKGLPRADAVRFFQRELGREFVPEEMVIVEEICAHLKDVPLAVVKAAAIAREEGLSPEQVLQVVKRPTEMAEDVEVGLARALGLALERLDPYDCQMLATLAAFGGDAVSHEARAEVSGLPDVDERLARLERLGLVHAQSPSYSLDPGFKELIQATWPLGNLQARIANYYLGWAKRHARDFARLGQEADSILAALEWGLEAEKWPLVTGLARALEAFLAWQGRWGAWEKVLTGALRAAQAAGDRAAEAWALHQLGTRALCLGEEAIAQSRLEQALRLREALGDREGALITQHNLNVLLGPPPAPPRRPPAPKAAPSAPGWLLPLVAVGTLIAIAFAVWYIWPRLPTHPPTATPVPSPTPTVTRVSTPTPMPPRPEVKVWLADGCDREYQPGQRTELFYQASVNGRVAIWLDGRELLFEREMARGETYSEPWGVTEEPGEHHLLAIFGEKEATGECRFSVPGRPPPAPKVEVWLADGCGREYPPGYQTAILVRANIEGLVEVQLDEEPIKRVPVSADKVHEEPWTMGIRPGKHRLWAVLRDEAGKVRAEAACPFVVTAPEAQVLFDFVAQADGAGWESAAGSLPFPGKDADERGFALWRTGYSLEDGSRAELVLETHPQWADYGTIQGIYKATREIVLQRGDLFVARVGFLQGAEEGDVTFRLLFSNACDFREFYEEVGPLRDRYDKILRGWEVPLNRFAGQNGCFALRVEAGETPIQDWAVWVEAKIIRP